MPALNGLVRRLTLRQIRAVVAMSETKSLIAAAETIGVSQPALTRTLHELETLLKVKLFERHPRGISPTEFGVALVESAEHILAEVVRLESNLNGISMRQTGALVIGALPSVGSGLMPGALAQFAESQPGVDIRLVQGRADELSPLLHKGAIEMLIGRLCLPEGEDGFRRSVLYDEPLGLLVRANHPFAMQNTQPDAEGLRSLRLIIPTDGQHMTADIDNWLSAMKVAPDRAIRTNSAATMRELLLASDDLLIVPSLMMAGDVKRGAIVRLHPPVPPPPREGGVLTRRGVPLSDAARSLLQALRAQIRIFANAGIVASR